LIDAISKSEEASDAKELVCETRLTSRTERKETLIQTLRPDPDLHLATLVMQAHQRSLPAWWS